MSASLNPPLSRRAVLEDNFRVAVASARNAEAGMRRALRAGWRWGDLQVVDRQAAYTSALREAYRAVVALRALDRSEAACKV